MGQYAGVALLKQTQKDAIGVAPIAPMVLFAGHKRFPDSCDLAFVDVTLLCYGYRLAEAVGYVAMGRSVDVRVSQSHGPRITLDCCQSSCLVASKSLAQPCWRDRCGQKKGSDGLVKFSLPARPPKPFHPA